MNLKNIKWNKQNYQLYLKYLLSIGETSYALFSSHLTETKYQFIGIRIPQLRMIAKEIGTDNINAFIKCNTNRYIEEVIIEGLVIAELKDEKTFDYLFNDYIYKIDNWEINDVFCNSLKIMEKNPNKYFKICTKLATNKAEFITRVGLIAILSHFVTDDNLKDIYKILDEQENTDYYASMGAAWLLCECLVKYYAKTINYLKVSKLNDWTFNKGIQKARESYRLTKEQKEYLKQLKRSKICKVIK